MRLATRLTLFFSLLASAPQVFAVPSFSRQTGLSCNVCHSSPPELTAFGRNFKLKGYVLSDMNDLDKVGNSKDLLLSKYLPLSVEIVLANTSFETAVPGTQNSAAGFPQSIGLLLAGGFASHLGGLAHVSYNHADDHFGLDDVDIRYANQGKLGGKDWLYGVLVSNTPTAEDVWNSTPSWGFPWLSSAVSVSPMASPIIGMLGADVAGLGAYSMWNNHLYTDFAVYRSEHAGGGSPITGIGYQYNISGAAPYWRAAWQQSFGDNYLEVGTYGIKVNSYRGAVSGPQDRYLDQAIDFQFERPFGSNLLDAHGSYTYERATLNAAVANGAAATAGNHLNAFKLDSTYHLTNRYNFTGAFFSTSGSSDALLYAPAAVSGSSNGSPGTRGYIAQFAYWPVQNIQIAVNYTGYLKFNGAGRNYDGANRNASDNNSAYVALQLNF